MLIKINTEEEARRYASGGSLNTLLHGLKQGKPVFVTVPEPNGNPKNDVDEIIRSVEEKQNG